MNMVLYYIIHCTPAKLAEDDINEYIFTTIAIIVECDYIHGGKELIKMM